MSSVLGVIVMVGKRSSLRHGFLLKLCNMCNVTVVVVVVVVEVVQ